MSKTLYEDRKIVLKSTGHDYDFVAYAENKTNAEVHILLDYNEELDIVGDEDATERNVQIKANDWVGFLANHEADIHMAEAIRQGAFTYV